MGNFPIAPNLAATPLSDLVYQCEGQIQDFKRNKSYLRSSNQVEYRDESPSCTEIVRRAANEDITALTILLQDITTPIIRYKCPRNLQDVADDFEQEVKLKLISKFHNRASPFQVKNFAQYREYVNRTVRSVIADMNSRQVIHNHNSNEENSYHNSDISELYEQLHTLVKKILTPIEYKIFFCRLIEQQKPVEIVKELEIVLPGLTIGKVHDVTADAMRKIRKHPQIRSMYQEYPEHLPVPPNRIRKRKKLQN